MEQGKNKFDDPQPADTTFGAPEVNKFSDDVLQNFPDTCAIQAQRLVLRDYGIEISEEELIDIASSNGWYFPGLGVPQKDVGKLLELEQFGIETEPLTEANIFNLASELAQGHRLIVGVDASELWTGGESSELIDEVKEKLKDWFNIDLEIDIPNPDHAVIVSGIDTSDLDNIRVIITDPGKGDVAKSYPLDHFLDAWEDSGFYVVTTKEPVPLEHNYETMKNFDYELGHLEEICGIRWDEFIEKNPSEFVEIIQEYRDQHAGGMIMDGESIPEPEDIPFGDEIPDEPDNRLEEVDSPEGPII